MQTCIVFRLMLPDAFQSPRLNASAACKRIAEAGPVRGLAATSANAKWTLALGCKVFADAAAELAGDQTRK